MVQEIQSLYGHILEKELLEEISRVATFAEVASEQELIQPGQYIKTMPLLLEGSIKILRPDAQGQHLLLYHLEQGETCAMTLNCCMGHTKSEILAVTETPVKLLRIPVQKMEEWLGNYRSWRNFVLNSYHRRMMELLESVDLIAFSNMEERLLSYLDEKQKLLKQATFKITHQQIADDLHSSRVVISRILKKLENRGTLKLHRNAIQLL
ncbi:MAG: Crp/Fnr family transcriptional regulator [Flavobacteriales bacterium]|jgi:CRP/FNR family transcriptional regulator|nr:Crp/Fnr family transcriptional regulator [Flavobacteriales bacterium]MDG1272192.1 Crp/Fnr family transcriptional regulator [Flavobacteriaceae bacterium]